MEAIFDNLGDTKIINAVGEKAWIPDSIEYYGFYNFQTAVPETFSRLNWTIELNADQQNYPKMMEFDIDKLV